ncbi:MAG TPA: glycosyltransferase family 4 protein [Anaerolineales bacterium]|nr:glycosyltransferase family 4 protein [Anaerolineales bacterium]
MHVGWVADGSLDQLSGGYLYDRIVVDYLRRNGVEVEIVSLPVGPYGVRLAGNFNSKLDRRLGDAGFDVLVEDELSHPALIGPNRRLARRLPRLRRVGLVHHLRSSEPGHRLTRAVLRRIERAYLASLDAFVFNSRTTRQVVEGLLGAEHPTAPRVVAVPGADRLPAAIDDQAIAARAKESGPIRILFVGNLIPRKGLTTLIEAVALLPPGTGHLTVAGDMQADRGHTRHVRRLVRRYHLDDRVGFRGALKGRDLSLVMSSHHVTTMPSSYEGYGMAHLEGMGHGLPAIAGSAGGAAEFLRDGENGFLVDPRDPVALAERLLSLHKDRSRLARLGLAARRTYLAHPTWEDAGATILGFLRSLIAEPPPLPSSVRG